MNVCLSHSSGNDLAAAYQEVARRIDVVVLCVFSYILMPAPDR